MTPEQEKAIRNGHFTHLDGGRVQIHTDESIVHMADLTDAVAALLVERDELRAFVGECTPAMLDGKTAFSRYYDMVDRCEKAEAERDAALAKLGEIEKVARFLLGCAPLCGCYFGDKPEYEEGRYWWRKYLRAALYSTLEVSGRGDDDGE